MEIRDVYSCDGSLAGRELVRGEPNSDAMIPSQKLRCHDFIRKSGYLR